MIPQISVSLHGIESQEKEKIFAKVKTNILYIFHIELLEKNRHKRPSLEEVLNHPWFAEFKDIH
jgi:hypothetical protein